MRNKRNKRFVLLFVALMEILAPLSKASAQMAGSRSFVNGKVRQFSDATDAKGNPVAFVDFNFNPETGLLENLKEGNLHYTSDFVDDRADRQFQNLSPREIRAADEARRKEIINEELKRRGNPAERLIKTLPTVGHLYVETVYFSILLGAMAVQQTSYRSKISDAGSNGIGDYEKNPVAIDQFLDSLKDPVAHLSFYTFMWASGITSDWIMDPRISTKLKQKYLSVLVPGLSMTAGSIVSQATGQFAATLKACYFDNIKRGRERARLGLNYPEIKDPKVPDPCEMAWKEWTGKKLFFSYAPAISSMLVATLGQGLINHLIKENLFSKKINPANGTIKLVANDAFRKLRLETAKRLAFMGLSYSTTIGPKGAITWAFKAAVKLGNIGLFLYPDHMMQDGFRWAYGNVFRGSIGSNLLGNDLYKIVSTKNKDDQWSLKTLAYLEQFSESLEEWRKLNNQDVETAHNAWLEKITSFSTSAAMQKNYYGSLIDDLKAPAVINNINESKLDSPRPYFYNYSNRTYPLWGVTPFNLMKYRGPDFMMADYLTNPVALEAVQMKTIMSEKRILCDTPHPELNKFDKDIISELCDLLETEERRQVGQALQKINEYTFFSKSKTPETALKLEKGADLLRAFRSAIGNPYPLSFPMEGYAYAFEVNPINRQHSTNFPATLMQRFHREKISDYLTFQMVCGNENDSKVVDDSDGQRLIFLAPKLVTLASPPALCKSRSEEYSPSSMIFRMNIETEKGTYKGIGSLIQDNLKPEILEIINSPDTERSYSQLWHKKYGTIIESVFDKLRIEYLGVQKKLIKNLDQKNSLWNQGTLENSLKKSLAQELRVNLMIQGELLRTLLEKKSAAEQKTYLSEMLLTESEKLRIWPKQETDINSSYYLNMRLGDSGLLLSQKYAWVLDYRPYFEPSKVSRAPQVFLFQGEAERLLKNMLIVLSSLEVQIKGQKDSDGETVEMSKFITRIDPEDKKTFEKQIEDFPKEIEKAFKSFQLDENQQKILEKTTSNIQRVLNSGNYYIKMAESITFDSSLREDNVTKVKERAQGVRN